MSFTLLLLPPQNDTTRDWANRLREALPEAQVVVAEDVSKVEQEILDADAAYGTLPDGVLEKAEKLRWLQAPAAAPPAGYYTQELIEHPVTVTNFRGIYNDHIGAHIMAFVLAFARGFQHYLPRQLSRTWTPKENAVSTVYLPEATALIIGVGGIGTETARHCAGFGMRIVGVDARLEEKPEGVAELHQPDALGDLLPKADFVIMTVPHTPETEGMMNAARFKRMKRTSFLINIGRGMTVKLDDLTFALETGEIAGAGLDVFETEPLPADHPLWTTPGVLLTPHVADSGPYLDERRFSILLENCRRFAAGKPLLNVVDKQRWF
jgi:phosphoglycerate dehydrogenase-like enzyme